MANSCNAIIILAAGESRRMESFLPKVLHKVGGRPILARVLEQAEKTNPFKIYIVVGKDTERVKNALYADENCRMENIEFINQPYALGTGNAVLCCVEHMKRSGLYEHGATITILPGDVPLIQSTTIQHMSNNFRCDARLLITQLEYPFGYGRIIEDGTGKFVSIVEERDCNQRELQITKVNCGIYSFRYDVLETFLPQIKPDTYHHDYHFTDIFEILVNNENNKHVELNEIPTAIKHEVFGVNTRKDLIKIEHILNSLNASNNDTL